MLERIRLESRFTRRPAFLFALLGLLTGPALAQTSWYVGPNAFPGSGTLADPYASIQFAIDHPLTNSGDTILVQPGTYVENVDLGAKGLWLRSLSGPSVTTIDGAGVERVIQVVGAPFATKIEGFTLTNGNAGAGGMGGCVLVSGTLVEVRDCTIVNGSASYGAGIAYDNASALICDSRIANNQTVFDPGLGYEGEGGGLWINATVATIVSCTIEANVGGVRGGGVYCNSPSAIIDDSTIQQNRAEAVLAPPRGGGLCLEGTVDVVDCQILDNDAIGNGSLGGGLDVSATGVISGCTIQDNTAGHPDGLTFVGFGGGLSGGDVIEDSLFRNNTAADESGGAHFGGTFDRCTFENNVSPFGGAARGGIFQDCSFTGNQAPDTFGVGRGGAVAEGSLTDCDLDGNSAVGRGGAVFSATVVRSVLSNNSVSAPLSLPAEGGAAHDSALTDCEVRNNEALPGSDSSEVALGGGLFGGTATGCLIWGNQAQTDAAPGEGGGTFQSDLTRCVVYDNFASLGAGVEFGDIEHCTIYDNAGEGVRSASSLHNSIVRANAVQIANTFPTWCNIEGGAFGTGNIDSPEIFWMPDPGPQGLGRDFHFASPLSPGIDSGDPTSPLDPDGTTADLGAYPWDPNYSSPPTIYCTAKASTTGGCLSEIDSTGTPTLTGPDDFHLTASGALALKPSIVFWGLDSAALPFLGGTLCVLPPLRRTPVQLSMGTNNQCDGVLDFAFTQLEMTSKGLSAGDQVYCQYRFRDPADPFGVAFSNALLFTVLP